LLGLVLQASDGVGGRGVVGRGVEWVAAACVWGGVDYELINGIVWHGCTFLPESRVYVCGPAVAGEGVAGFDRNVITF